MKTSLRALIRKHKIIGTVVVIIVAIVVLSIAWDVSASIRGRIHARFDIARGHYKILGYGLPPPWRAEYVRLLRERYGIEFHESALCIVSRSLVAYVDAYDEVSEAAANNKFGHNVFEEAAEDARLTWMHAGNKPPEWSVVKDLFPYAPAKARDSRCFRSFSPGVDMEEIVKHCGRPDEDIGSGLYVFLYHLQDGSTVSISTPYLNRVDQISYTLSTGKRSPL